MTTQNTLHSKNLTKILVIEDDIKTRRDLSVIFNFVGEECELIAADAIETHHWQQKNMLCVIGSIHTEQSLTAIVESLKAHAKIPIIALSTYQRRLSRLPNFLGEIHFPLNYSQLIDALRHAKAFTAKDKFENAALPSVALAFWHIIGKDSAIVEVRQLIKQVANKEASVLIFGESGTGKELVARNIHFHSPRSDKPFVTLNCGAIASELLEIELFGYEKGAFSGALTAKEGIFEQANGGTLFLDEIGDMSHSMQVKLLRLLQERKFERVGGSTSIKANVRILAATHRNLQQMMKTGKFREDLYYRLNVFPIEMPALRNRKEDIPLLLQELISRISEQSAQIHLTNRAIASLLEHDWPGNIRELENLIERLSILYPNQVIDLNRLPQEYRYSDIPEFKSASLHDLANCVNQATKDNYSLVLNNDIERINFAQSAAMLSPEGIDLKAMLADLEINLIRQALDIQTGVVTKAASMLGMRRTTLIEKMRKYGLQR